LRGPEAPKPLGYRMSSRLSAKKKERDPNKPKRPQSGWLRYLGEFRKEQKGKILAKDVLGFAGEKWKTMSEAEKKPYNDAFEADKAVYEVAMAAYNADHVPPKRPPTAYIVFSGEFIKSNLGLDIVEASKLAGDKWKALTDKQKAPYKAKVAKLKKEYEVKLAAYEAKQQARVDKFGGESTSVGESDGEHEATAQS